MKKVLILVLILLMLFFILAGFAPGQGQSSTREFLKENQADWHKSCLIKN